MNLEGKNRSKKSIWSKKDWIKRKFESKDF